MKKEGAGAAVAAPVVAGLADVYFDYDKYNIRPGDAEVLKKNYGMLASKRRQGKDRRQLRRERNRRV